MRAARWRMPGLEVHLNCWHLLILTRRELSLYCHKRVSAPAFSKELPYVYTINRAAVHLLTLLLSPTGSSNVQPNPLANQQPKLTPPALDTATSEQLNAKVS